MSVLVYIENIEGNLKKPTFEVVSYAKTVADLLNQNLIAISIGDVIQQDLELLGNYGVSKVLNVNKQDLKSFVNQAYASIIAKAATQENANVIILSHTFSAKGLAPRIAVKLNAGLAEAAIEIPDVKNNTLIIKKSVFSSKAFAFVELYSVNKVISINPNSYKLNKISEELALVEAFNCNVNESDFKQLIKDIIKAKDKVSLPDAEIVVSAGRGLKGPENWGMIEELADVLGAALACSKPVSDAHWRPHEEHVGQTGITVSPNLYIAIGISGAIQHLAGVSSSKVIVVINNDAQAPFFKVADYGIVGDAFEVVPKLIKAIKSFKNQ